MTELSKYNDPIESYLDGTLSAAERDLFDEQLKSDPVLGEKLSERIMLQKSWMKIAQHKQVKQRISNLIKIEERQQNAKRTIWLAAASIIVIIGISSIFFFQKNRNDSEYLTQVIKIKDSQIIIQGKRNEMQKFGSADTIKNTIASQNCFPMDNAVFQTSDTITFSWPSNNIKEKLIIFDENWIKVSEIQLPKGVAEYKFIPANFKTGTYTWILTPNSVKYKFSIK